MYKAVNFVEPPAFSQRDLRDWFLYVDLIVFYFRPREGPQEVAEKSYAPYAEGNILTLVVSLVVR